MRHVVTSALEQLRRGSSPVSLFERARELAAAKLYLRDVSTGSGVRCLGRPRIVNHGDLRVGDRTRLRSVIVPVELTCEEGASLTIGADCFLDSGVSIGCTKRVELGDRCALGPYVMIIDTAFHDLYDRSKRPEGMATVLESDVAVGAKVSVMPGVRIGRGSVIATGAVVSRDVPPFSVAAGIPAKVIERLDPEKFVRGAPPEDR